jgi:hypothetical protein
MKQCTFKIMQRKRENSGQTIRRLPVLEKLLKFSPPPPHPPRTCSDGGWSVLSGLGFGLILLFFLLCSPAAQAQKISEKTNVLFLATLSPNIGTEIVLSNRFTLDASLSYHPWKLSKTIHLKHWLFSPELRWWYCRSNEGSFWGLHALTGQFDVHSLPFTRMPKEYEYGGFLYGGGLSYGYHLPLSVHWGLEFTVGAGYLRIEYDKYECTSCREQIAEGTYNYFGPTRAGISLVYFLQ